MPDEIKFSELSLITTIPGTAVIPLLSDGVSVGTQWSDLAKAWEAGTDLTSASTLAVLANGGYFHVTGTTTITALSQSSNLRAGRLIQLKFNGILTLTHNATSLILPGAANITTAAGDIAMFRCEDSANNYWRCVQYQKASGLATVVAPILSAPTKQIFSTAGTFTWTKPAGCRFIRTRTVGSGGGGASANGAGNQGAAGGGGSAGGYSEKWIDVTAITSATVTVPAGGAGATSGNSAGSNGGTASFGSYSSATGGIGGVAGSSAAGSSVGSPVNGGTGSSGDINTTGGSGKPGMTLITPADANIPYCIGGEGGSSVLGAGGAAAIHNATSGHTNGTAGGAPGAGGSGGASAHAGGNASGGNGADGIVIVEEFY